MVILTMPLAPHAVYVNANDSTDQKCHAAPHFNHFDVRNGMVPLLMQSVSCDTDTRVHGIA